MKYYNNNFYNFIFLIILSSLFASCSNDQLPQIAPQPIKPLSVKISTTTAKIEKPKYIYKGDRFRDPFIPLTDSGFSSFSNEAVFTPNIGSLSLKGILDDGTKKMAVISDGSMTYVLKDGHLFDNRNRQIKNIGGIIKKESVLITGADKTSKELKLRSKE